MPARPIALTCGEPAGIGPELAAKAWHALKDEISFIWIGDPGHLPPGTPHVILQSVTEACAIMPRALPVLAQTFDGAVTPGTPQPHHASDVIEAIAAGARLALSGEVAALCTMPINKQALQDGGSFAFPGHTEFLGALAGGITPVMMLVSDMLKVVPVTIHTPLRDVPDQLTQSLLEETIQITQAALRRDFGILHPRLAISGMNPHAGEGGKIGREEQDVIIPVLDRLRAAGYRLSG
ncbi:MAG: 4-hydroxythreonine-4-phosphate dehydrogenase PdxA, partial [Pseudomonadota bacterium]